MLLLLLCLLLMRDRLTLLLLMLMLLLLMLLMMLLLLLLLHPHRILHILFPRSVRPDIQAVSMYVPAAAAAVEAVGVLEDSHWLVLLALADDQDDPLSVLPLPLQQRLRA